MTEQEIREMREQLAIENLKQLEASLVAECERLAKIIAEHEYTRIMTVVEPQQGGAT